jgi:hypothetical protein
MTQIERPAWWPTAEAVEEPLKPEAAVLRQNAVLLRRWR